MYSWELRSAKAVATRAKLAELIALMVSSGVWTVVRSTTLEGQESPTWVVVVDAGGRAFDVGAPWGEEGRIHCSPAAVDGPDGRRISPRDVLSYREATLEAKASANKAADALLKEFNRRILQHPEAREQANKVRDYVAARQAESDALADRIKTLESLGYQCGRRDSTYKVSMHKPGAAVSSLELHSTGHVHLDRLGFHMDKLGAILAALK